MSNVDDFFVKHKVQERFCIETPSSRGDELLSQSNVKKSPKIEINPQQNVNIAPQGDITVNNSDLEGLRNIENIKRFLLEDLPCTKLKNTQRSCSLPHSPNNICMDINDAKTCLSFEDLNLDLSDLALDKSDNLANKSDDIPHTLTEEDVNSFLITSQPESESMIKYEDDFDPQDMEIEKPIESSVNTIHETDINMPTKANRTSTPIKQTKKPTVLEFCVEKLSQSTPPKTELITDVKTELDDFIDVESCNDTVVPVLEANNLNSLLEQFEATEQLNTKTKRIVVKTEEPKVKTVNKTSLTNGMRLQDAGVQLNKNKMRQILMPSTINATLRRSPSPVHSDHDYCTSKKQQSLPKLKKGQSLLKPEVLSSNSRILNSRHRSCKNKKVVYNFSDDESEKCKSSNSKNKKGANNRNDSDVKLKKQSIKQPVKPVAQATCRKKLSPTHCVESDSVKNISVINKNASKACDTPCSQSSNGSIKLTIKNKSEVILSCDFENSHKSKHSEKSKNISASDKKTDNDKISNNIKGTKMKEVKTLKIKDIEVSSSKSKSVHSKEQVKESSVSDINVKEEPQDNFYTALFSNKQDVQIPPTMVKTEKRPFDEELQRISEITIKKETEQPQKKKKLNLHEYKMRRVNSNNSSTTVSPEAIFPDLPHLNIDKTLKSTMNQIQNGPQQIKSQTEPEPKKIFDPIREASRKILMNTMKQKARRKRDEDIMSKIPKIENLELQPLISDAEMMKMVGMAPTEEQAIPVAIVRPQAPADYEEIILVSIGVNTDENVFKKLESVNLKRKSKSPQADTKGLINFKIKKTDHVLKQNVFEPMRRDKKCTIDEKKQDTKIDKERYRDITAALKRVEKQVDPKIASNSLFASIQDVVMKKAPEDVNEELDRTLKAISAIDKKAEYQYVKTPIVREYDMNVEHGEDKVILYLKKDRIKPPSSTTVVQTEMKYKSVEKVTNVPINVPTNVSKEMVVNRRRNDSDMSMSSEGSPVRKSKSPREEKLKVIAVKPKEKVVEKRSLSKEKRPRSKDKYETKNRRRSRSHSRSRRRRRSRSRSRSRSGGRYNRYRRSDSPYRRKRRSRSPYRRRALSPRRSPSGRRSVSGRHSPVHRRSPSLRHDHRRSSSRTRQIDLRRSKTPIPKKVKLSPQNSIEKINLNDKKPKSMTPPLRKPTISESSDSSTR
ncbi:unnamed protein product [Diatraea saccharalis]|uniref:Uncharacterized protein n=1 Tax=Diatraea saccharalis TaxID=40085 RepID=A0A9P0CAR3_9NEOP|nr:unnamed protein product [Diatraea saccharalis]